MLKAALRRLVLLLAGAAAVTAAIALLFGVLAGASAARSISIGFYSVGCFFLVAGFVVGNRGPVRVRSESPGAGVAFFPMFGARRLRWATRDEQQETIGQSALFIFVGLALVFLGAVFDSAHRLW